MTIYDLRDSELNPAIAYIVGLAYPLYREVYYRGSYNVIGAINYNYGYVTESELSTQKKKIENLMKTYGVSVSVLPNKGITPKAGFAILIDKDDATTTECKSILSDLVSDISVADDEIQESFARGVFDGRSSYDTTLNWLSVDVDRDYAKQDEITEVLENVGLDINLNRRDANHPKNDQIRIKDSTTYIMRNIGLYSPSRQRRL